MEKRRYYIHYICEKDGLLLFKSNEELPPSAGDEMRIDGKSGTEVYKITRRVWVYDEPECPFNRVNVGVELLEPTP